MGEQQLIYTVTALLIYLVGSNIESNLQMLLISEEKCLDVRNNTETESLFLPES
jgi:hypothetical protein